jgi:hypothetical protein
MFFSGLSLKTGSYDLVIYVLKSQRLFLDLGFKTKLVTVCRLRQENQWEEDGVRHALRSSGLLHRKANQARVSQFVLKLVEE